MRRWQFSVLLVVIFLAVGFVLLSLTDLDKKQSLSAPGSSPSPSSTPSVSPIPIDSPTPSQPPIEVSNSPTPSQTPSIPVRKSTQPKVKVTVKATPKAKDSKSPTPTPRPSLSSSSQYPRMRGDVVPQNFTNKPYTAGKDIPVGLYHSSNSVCGYQIRMTDKSLFNVSVYEKGSTVVEIREGEQLLNSDCSIVFGPPTFQEVLLVGTHLVGLDIEPGIYHAENYLSCMFALASRAEITRGNETQKMGFGNLNGMRDMLVPADAESVTFGNECGVLTKVG